MPGTLQVCPHVWACVFVPRALTDRAPVASVIAKKVSAKSFFIDCSFHYLNHRTNSDRAFLLFLASKSAKKDGLYLMNLKSSCLCDLAAIKILSFVTFAVSSLMP